MSSIRDTLDEKSSDYDREPERPWPTARWIWPLQFLLLGFVGIEAGMEDSGIQQVLQFAAGSSMIASFVCWVAKQDLCFRFADLSYFLIFFPVFLAPESTLVWGGRCVYVIALALSLVGPFLGPAAKSRRIRHVELDGFIGVLIFVAFAPGSTVDGLLGNHFMIMMMMLFDMVHRGDYARRLDWRGGLPKEHPDAEKEIVPGP